MMDYLYRGFYLRPLLFAVMIIYTGIGFGQDSVSLQIKTIKASRISQMPVIDGIPDVGLWGQLQVASGFIQYEPYNGQKSLYETEIRFGYNETGLYMGAFMHDPHPDSISAELGKRDQVDELNTDYITADILPYNDGLTMFEFKITPEGLQSDNKFSAVGRESSWDAVWESAATINDSGWIAEVFIPYSALRFPKTEVQTWGINMWRNLNRRNEKSTWSFVPNDEGEMFKYYGTVTGMEGIKPPLRLSLWPYLAGYLEKSPDQKQWDSNIRGGMDLKYGISQSYTLDMQLIPDFGQVQSDDIILNLTPFEVRYDEKRQFFTEGTELFQKCDIFYSRRVGSVPKGYDTASDSLKTNEKLTSNPDQTQIINSTKISGRNQNGLGLGFYNGMTTNTWATVQDTLTGAGRKISTQPFTNYNVMVVDQNLKNNSYFTFINTNYWTPDWRYCSNVTGGETKLVNKAATFAFKGRLNVSQTYREIYKPLFGYQSLLNFYRPGGVIRYSLVSQVTDNHYDVNDMGFLEKNNEIQNEGALSYNIFKPVWRIMKSKTELGIEYYTRYQPYALIFLDIELNNGTVFKNYWEFYEEIAYRPKGYYDYYEPRVEGWYYHRPPSWDGSFGFTTDLRHKLAVDFGAGFMFYPENNGSELLFSLQPRYRISDRLTTSIMCSINPAQNDYGWVDTQYDPEQNPLIYFGRRDVLAVNNVLDARYVFTKNISLNLRARHYWSTVEYLDFYTLLPDGELQPASYEQNEDIDFNAFNIDLQFAWYFAPGSEMSVVWKNNILTQGDNPSGNYFDAFAETIQSPQTNSLSLRILYYIDYPMIKKAFGRKGK